MLQVQLHLVDRARHGGELFPLLLPPLPASLAPRGLCLPKFNRAAFAVPQNTLDSTTWARDFVVNVELRARLAPNITAQASEFPFNHGSPPALDE
jgi:hypothetical protein